ncbi:MAG: hypothetical protein V9G20_13450 [Candidatus Promineifilaceae bacterium]
MGGRGAKSKGRGGILPAAALADLPYTITSFDDGLGGATYPFLEQTRRAWRILTHPVGETSDPHPAHTYGLDEPTLRWVNGSQVSDLYVDGLTTEQFLKATGLELNLHKGGFVLSKRLSRVMRPHFVSGFFQPEEVQVGYLEQTPEEAKVWDGAGLISRQMLKRMLLSDDLTPAKRERLETELRHARRVEFTVMTERGQDKGHAIVADDLRDELGNPVDFLLPRDTKKEVKLVNGRTFVGLSFVHGHNDMRLDIQSLINLYPFFTEEQLLGWLKDEGELFTQSVQTGQVGEVMARIDRHTTLDEVQSWPLREYLASGGQPMWFGSHVKSLMNQHLKRLNESTLGKMRLPIPGGRHYVLPVAVGERAGVKGLDVPRGHIKIDPKYGTAWVNDEDWLWLYLTRPKVWVSPGFWVERITMMPCGCIRLRTRMGSRRCWPGAVPTRWASMSFCALPLIPIPCPGHGLKGKLSPIRRLIVANFRRALISPLPNTWGWLTRRRRGAWVKGKPTA